MHGLVINDTTILLKKNDVYNTDRSRLRQMDPEPNRQYQAYRVVLPPPIGI